MQLTSAVAQPPTLPAATMPDGNPLLRLTTILRGQPVGADQGAPPAAAPAAPAASAADIAAASAPVEDAGFAAKMFGSVGSAQQRYLANQQLLGAISHAFGERISQIGAQAWAMLRGRPVE